MGICYKLYHFITKTLASQVLKTVTLGCSTHYSSTSTAPRGSETPYEDGNDKEFSHTQGLLCDSIYSPAQQAQHKDTPCKNIDEKVRENTTTLPTTPLPKRISLRKVVSINDNVEEILPGKKNKRRIKSFQKSSSLDQEEEPEPLRSILKVGSDLKD